MSEPVLDDYEHGLKVERALANLESIPNPLERVRAADELADQAREVQSEISMIRKRAIYEATLRPGANGGSVAAELGVSAKAVSSAISTFRAKDQRLFRAALEVLIEKEATRTSRQALASALRTRDVLLQARVVVSADHEMEIKRLGDEDYEIIQAAVDRARRILSTSEIPHENLQPWRLTLADFQEDWSSFSPLVLHAAQVVGALPGIRIVDASLWEESDETGPRWWISWKILPAEARATVFDAGPHRDGFAVTEWLAWFVSDLARSGFPIWMQLSSPPPYLNEPGESLSFSIWVEQGEDKRLEPDEFSQRLKEVWGDPGTGFTKIDWPTAEGSGPPQRDVVP
ncbi:hypothetical protein MRI28_30620 [Nocardiopsis dassonvillei]|uniref:hypothetical protein n=1 Tax=Nocardiopsis dassonvillei TaxID=2014 RepID=UPI00200F283E|nr:hypothetical protein [Nocardiopsis dassonvillei]MCK9873924.1 hypothetical protein [Nocardiopsis dassonvillei]